MRNTLDMRTSVLLTPHYLTMFKHVLEALFTALPELEKYLSIDVGSVDYSRLGERLGGTRKSYKVRQLSSVRPLRRHCALNTCCWLFHLLSCSQSTMVDPATHLPIYPVGIHHTAVYSLCIDAHKLLVATVQPCTLSLDANSVVHTASAATQLETRRA